MGIQLVDWDESGVTIGTLSKHFAILHPDLELMVEINGKMHAITGLSQYRPVDNPHILMVAHVSDRGYEVQEWKMTKSSAQPIVPSSGSTPDVVTAVPSASTSSSAGTFPLLAALSSK